MQTPPLFILLLLLYPFSTQSAARDVCFPAVWSPADAQGVGEMLDGPRIYLRMVIYFFKSILRSIGQRFAMLCSSATVTFALVGTLHRSLLAHVSVYITTAASSSPTFFGVYIFIVIHSLHLVNSRIVCLCPEQTNIISVTPLSVCLSLAYRVSLCPNSVYIMSEQPTTCPPFPLSLFPWNHKSGTCRPTGGTPTGCTSNPSSHSSSRPTENA